MKKTDKERLRHLKVRSNEHEDLENILNYGTQKNGPKKYKEFDTTKLGNLRDVTEEKFRLKLIDHYHRMLQKRQKLPNDYIFALSKLLRFKDKNYQNNRKILKDVFVDLRFDVLDELIAKVYNNENENNNKQENNTENTKNLNSPNDEKKEKNTSCFPKSKIKTFPLANMKPSRNPATSAELLPNSSANFFKEKTSIFNIPGFMVNLNLDSIINNNYDKNSVYLNSNSNLNKFTNEGNENFYLDQSEVKFFKSENNEIQEHEKNRSHQDIFYHDNRSNLEDNKSNHIFNINSNKSLISISNNGNNIVNHGNASANKTLLIEKNVNESMRNNKEFNTEIKNDLNVFSSKMSTDNKLKFDNFYNLDNRRRKVKNINNKRDGEGEYIDYYVISDSFESIDSFKLNKFKKKLEKNNVYFGYKSEIKNKKKINLSKSLALSKNLSGSAGFASCHINNLNNFNSNNNSLMGEMQKNKLNNNNKILPSIGFGPRERNKQKTATANRKFLSYILKVTNKLDVKKTSENIVVPDENNSNNNDNNEYYLDKPNANQHVDNICNYIETNEYSGLSPKNEFSPTIGNTLSRKISRNLINLYNEYRSHKKQDSNSFKNLQFSANKESLSNRNTLLDPKNTNFLKSVKIHSDLESKDLSHNKGHNNNDLNYNDKNQNYNCSNDIENFEFNKNIKAESQSEHDNRNKIKLNISNLQKMHFDNKFEGKLQQLEVENYNFYSKLINKKNNEANSNQPKSNDINNYNTDNTHKTENSNNLLRKQSKQKTRNMSFSTDLKLITSSKLKVNSELLIKEPKRSLRYKVSDGNPIWHKDYNINETNLVNNQFKTSKIKLASVNKLQEKVQSLKETNQPKFNVVNKYSGSLIKSLEKINRETKLMIDFMDKTKFRSHSKVHDLKIFQGRKKYNKSNTKFE